jgi:hypothetical protein
MIERYMFNAHEHESLRSGSLPMTFHLGASYGDLGLESPQQVGLVRVCMEC